MSNYFDLPTRARREDNFAPRKNRLVFFPGSNINFPRTFPGRDRDCATRSERILTRRKIGEKNEPAERNPGEEGDEGRAGKRYEAK